MLPIARIERGILQCPARLCGAPARAHHPVHGPLKRGSGCSICPGDTESGSEGPA
jgi:hypothetical protein